MPAQTDNGVAQDAPVAHGKTNRETSKKRQRIQPSGDHTVHEGEESSDHDDEAYIRARTLTAAREVHDVKRVRNLETTIKRIEKHHYELDTSHNEHKEAVEARQITADSSISKLEKDVEGLPTMTAVLVIVGGERKAWGKALNEVVTSTPTQITKSIKISLDGFQQNVMKPAMATEMAPITSHMAGIETSLNTSRETLKSLDLRVRQQAEPGALRDQIIDEAKKLITEADRKASTSFASQLDTAIGKCTSDWAMTVLHFTDLHQQQGKCHEQNWKDLKETINSYTEKIDTVDTQVSALQQDLQVKRRKNADLYDTQQQDRDQFQQSINTLLGELQAEREERMRMEKTNENILRRLEGVEREVSAAREAQGTFDKRLKSSSAQTAAKFLVHEKTFRMELDDHAKTAKANTARAEEDLRSEANRNKGSVMSHIDSIFNANTIDGLRKQVEKLETATCREHEERLAEVAIVKAQLSGLDKAVVDLGSRRPGVSNLNADFVVLKKTVVDLAATTNNVNKKVDLIDPISADLAYLKDQHQDHVASFKADIQEQANIAEDHMKSLDRKLGGRIRDQELALRGHLLETHNMTDVPTSLWRHAQAYAPHDNTRLRNDLQTLELAKRHDGFLEREFRPLVEQHKGLAERHTTLSIRVSNIEARDHKRTEQRKSLHLTQAT